MRLAAPIYQLKRRARLLARNEKIALHEALDRLAREEGFAGWSLLSSQLALHPPSTMVLSRLSAGDRLLLGARPGQGKTLLGLRLLLDAAGKGRRAVFFTLEYTDRESRDRIRALDRGGHGRGDKVEIVASDDICAVSIIRHLYGSRRGTVAVIDYLQILDQQRNKPALSEQMQGLHDFSRNTGVILGFLSQIDRSFDPNSKPLPDICDIRLPNPIDPGFFTRYCFLHDGQARFLLQ
jgi:hypothetical protein